MDKNERNLHAQQHKDRVDLTTQHAKTWEKFQQRKEDYRQKYGTGHANELLRQEKEDLEAEFNQEISDLARRHDEQWLNYHEAPASSAPHNLPRFLQKAEPAKDQINPDIQEKTIIQAIADPYQRTLFANPIKQADKEQNQLSDKASKHLDQSQDYMNAMVSSQKATPTKEKGNDEKPVSMSTRFSQGLSYTRAAEQPSRPSDPNKDIDRD